MWRHCNTPCLLTTLFVAIMAKACDISTCTFSTERNRKQERSTKTFSGSNICCFKFIHRSNTMYPIPRHFVRHRYPWFNAYNSRHFHHNITQSGPHSRPESTSMPLSIFAKRGIFQWEARICEIKKNEDTFQAKVRAIWKRVTGFHTSASFHPCYVMQKCIRTLSIY